MELEDRCIESSRRVSEWLDHAAKLWKKGLEEDSIIAVMEAKSTLIHLEGTMRSRIWRAAKKEEKSDE